MSLREAFRDEAAWNAREWALAQTRAGGGKAYLYYFVHQPPVAPGQPDRGAQHGAEIPYAFNIPAASWADVDRGLADTMSSYWVNFATRGDPNGAGLPHWPAFQPTARERLILGPKIEVGPVSTTCAWHCSTASPFGVPPPRAFGALAQNLARPHGHTHMSSGCRVLTINLHCGRACRHRRLHRRRRRLDLAGTLAR